MKPAAWGRTLRRLVELGLLDGDAAVDARIDVACASRSNQVGIVNVDRRPALVIKRNEVAFDRFDATRAEVGAYRWLGSRRATASLAPRLVEVVDGVLVIEAITGGTTLSEALQASPDDSGALLARLGHDLGVLHAADFAHAELLERRPWVLGVREGVVPDPIASDPEIVELARRIAASPPLRAALDELDADWAPLAPLHGDVKFDNVLVVPGADDAEERRLVLLDWELAGLGLPAWDLAGIADGLVAPGLMSLEGTDGLRQADFAEPAIRAHREAAGARLAVDARSLHVATACRLAQSAMQLCAMRHTTPDSAEAAEKVLAGAERLAADLRTSVEELAPCFV